MTAADTPDPSALARQVLEAAETASAGPWGAIPDPQNPHHLSHVQIRDAMWPTAWPADAAFIALSRTAAPALAAAYLSLRARLDAVEALADSLEVEADRYYEARAIRAAARGEEL